MDLTLGLVPVTFDVMNFEISSKFDHFFFKIWTFCNYRSVFMGHVQLILASMMSYLVIASNEMTHSRPKLAINFLETLPIFIQMARTLR